MSQTPKRRRPPRQSAASATPVGRPVRDPARQRADPAAAPGSEGPGAPVGAPGPAAPEGPPPLRLTLAAAVAGVEGLAVAAWGVATAAGGGTSILAGLLVLLLAALPLAAAYGLRRARRWSRGPALIMQLLSLPIAWTMLHSEGLVIAGGAVLGALALGGLALLVHPATTDALGIGRTAA